MGSTTVETPTAPAAPTAAQNMTDWIANYPAMFALQQQYAPLEAQQQVELAQKYAQPYGEALKTAQEAMYPGTTALQEQLASQASAGMQGGVPDWQREQYLSDLRANLGTNAGSPIAADYTSRGLLQQNQDWQKYYQNLALSVTGRQPLTQATTPGYSNYASTYTPGSVAQTNSTNYGNYANAYSSMYGANANLAGSQNQMWGQALGGLMGGLGTGLGTAWAKSSRRYKKNIKLWE